MMFKIHTACSLRRVTVQNVGGDLSSSEAQPAATQSKSDGTLNVGREKRQSTLVGANWPVPWCISSPNSSTRRTSLPRGSTESHSSATLLERPTDSSEMSWLHIDGWFSACADERINVIVHKRTASTWNWQRVLSPKQENRIGSAGVGKCWCANGPS